MVKGMLGGLALVALVFALFMFVMSDFLFPATYAALVDAAASEAVTGYGGEVLAWATGQDGATSGLISVSQIPFVGYQGATSFACLQLVAGVGTSITDCFGTARICSGGVACPHPGIDIATSQSTGHAVLTPWGGMVTFTGYYGAWGNTAVIENQGYQLLLTHLSAFSVSVGEVITAGTQVGLSGGAVGDPGAGSSTGPHLHFEERICTIDSAGGAVCRAADPMRSFLPGQAAACDWYAAVSRPEFNAGCTQ